MIGYREQLYKNQLDLIEVETKGSVFGHTLPIYQNPNIQRQSTDPYRISQDYSPNLYRKTILVNFDKLPDWLRGFTDGMGMMGINTSESYEVYDVMSHEATHLLHLDWPEHTVRSYSPRGIRNFEEFQRRFPQFSFVIRGRV